MLRALTISYLLLVSVQSWLLWHMLSDCWGSPFLTGTKLYCLLNTSGWEACNWTRGFSFRSQHSNQYAISGMVNILDIMSYNLLLLLLLCMIFTASWWLLLFVTLSYQTRSLYYYLWLLLLLLMCEKFRNFISKSRSYCLRTEHTQQPSFSCNVSVSVSDEMWCCLNGQSCRNLLTLVKK